ncbi:4-hydroxy-tetrahydrodipicolinate synthase [Luteibacter yeojuensis]|uniref:4-hydroxy-tetrahydrodipicolinate synthase n=1 Tax=Luteibacter yeojuensis TaxID=345309 RepID=A0A0F3L3T1_9GAMM|nr:4-hydroxy-tetrahydrodipicolinate synthase [Luteibacter yeojuensis]KJV37019.1 dihydrodipicolinate synthase [Luteibacter yeojuensis]
MDISGSITALATPFAADGSLDLDAFGRLLDQQLAGGTQAVVVAGSTGESHFLEHDEFERLLAFAVKHIDKRIPVIAGTGEAGTAKTIATTRLAKALGADAALVVAPFYVRPTQEGMRRHFLAVADEGGLPVILYNVPPRTGVDIAPETVAALREHPGILGIKEARGDIERIRAMAELIRPDFVYLSGDDGSAHQAMLAGAAGTISVVANLVPGAFRELCDAARSGSAERTASATARLAPLIDALNCAPNPIPVKAGLALLGLGSAAPRLPLVPLEAGPALAKVRETLAALAPLAAAA